ncbi:MAG TPA: dihydroorotase [Verrucomicrobiota bacterium]|nr:dihydroorotase [Verrucomicrobiota bacterium]HNU53105.1 dihydroorotase [Verrucomicrobiota bacterium]
MKALLLVQGRVIDPSQRLDGVMDVLLADGKVAAFGAEAVARAPAGAERLDLRGLIVCPGLIDLHVHLREPGQSAKETIATGTAAAARGGFTTVVCMPNTQPVIDSPSVVAWILERAAREARVNLLVAGALSTGIGGEELAPIGSLRKAGVVAVTDDGRCIQNHELMRRALEYSTMFDVLVMDHCQDYSLVTDGVMHDGYFSLQLGLRGWPAEGEEMMVARNILLAERTGARIHCQHVSAAGSVRLIREAKARGLPVSGEACPHHFTLTDAAVAGSETFWSTDGQGLLPEIPEGVALPGWPSYDTNFKMNPPLRTARDREAIWAGLADGTLEVIASDHAPHCNHEKEVEFDYAPFGIIGLETELALALTVLVHARRLPLADLIARFTTGPAQLLRLHTKGSLRPGLDADVTVFDPDLAWTFQAADTASKSHNSPFLGWPLKGKTLATIVGGNFAWRDPALKHATEAPVRHARKPRKRKTRP